MSDWGLGSVGSRDEGGQEGAYKVERGRRRGRFPRLSRTPRPCRLAGFDRLASQSCLETQGLSLRFAARRDADFTEPRLKLGVPGRGQMALRKAAGLGRRLLAVGTLQGKGSDGVGLGENRLRRRSMPLWGRFLV